MEAIKLAKDLIEAGISPDAEYVAAAGYCCGWVKAWKVESGYLVYWGDNEDSYAVFEKHVEMNELADWLEWDTDDELDAIAQRANVRGADAIPEATEDDEGPFYVLMTRYCYGPIETSRFVIDDRGEPLEFETLQDARSWIERADSEVYYLAHNEYARPTYKVVTT